MEMNFNSNGSSFMFGAEMYCEFNIQSIHSMIYLTKWWNENQPRAFVYFFFPGNRSKHSLYRTENSEYNGKAELIHQFTTYSIENDFNY